MELFALYFQILLFYIELFWILNYVDIEEKNIKAESFPPSADLALDNIYIYIYVCVCVCVCVNNLLLSAFESVPQYE